MQCIREYKEILIPTMLVYIRFFFFFLVLPIRHLLLCPSPQSHIRLVILIEVLRFKETPAPNHVGKAHGIRQSCIRIMMFSCLSQRQLERCPHGVTKKKQVAARATEGDGAAGSVLKIASVVQNAKIKEKEGKKEKDTCAQPRPVDPQNTTTFIPLSIQVILSSPTNPLDLSLSTCSRAIVVNLSLVAFLTLASLSPCKPNARSRS